MAGGAEHPNRPRAGLLDRRPPADRLPRTGPGHRSLLRDYSASAFALPALRAGLPAGRLSDKTGGSVVALTGMVITAAGTTGAFSLPNRWTLLAAAGCADRGGCAAPAVASNTGNT